MIFMIGSGCSINKLIERSRFSPDVEKEEFCCTAVALPLDGDEELWAEMVVKHVNEASSRDKVRGEGGYMW